MSAGVMMANLPGTREVSGDNTADDLAVDARERTCLRPNRRPRSTAAEGQGITADGPEYTDDGHRGEAVHHRAEHVWCAQAHRRTWRARVIRAQAVLVSIQAVVPGSTFSTLASISELQRVTDE